LEHIHTIDLIIIVAFVAFSMGAGVILSRRATKDMEHFFVTGRSLPWWLAGVSMIASAFAIDTPLGITDMVAANGIKGVWYAWSFILGGAGVLGAFIFSSLLRRSRIITTAELVELRYSGRPATVLRVFKACYFGILSNCLVMAWVMKAVTIFLEAVVGWNSLYVLGAMLLFVLVYTVMAGMWGIVVTDFFQYFISTAGSLALAIIAIRHIGGMDGLVAGIQGRYGMAETVSMLRFVPRQGTPFFVTFIVFILFKWWGNPPEAINQRIVSSKDEKHASFATLLFATVHFALNYWPMILVALVSLVVYPDLPPEHASHGYAKLIVELLPAGLLGLMLAALLAAFMSTIDTHVNVGAAYVVNDIYRRFLNRNGSRRHYVRAGQVGTILILLIAVVISFFLKSVGQAWYYLAMLTAGYGFVIVARWFWWRINAWSELAAMASSFAGSMIANLLLPRLYGDIDFGVKFLFILLFCTISWVTVTYLTAPEDESKLHRFCRLVKPYRYGWKKIAERYDDVDWNTDFPRHVLHFFLGATGIFGLCFATGHTIFHNNLPAILLFGMTAVCAVSILVTWKPITQ
jgi:SSS family transporter